MRYRLVHTGQHYDARLSGDFFAQLGIPEPEVNMEVGSGTQAEQTAAIMVGYERLLLAAPSGLCLVVGDDGRRGFGSYLYEGRDQGAQWRTFLA